MSGLSNVIRWEVMRNLRNKQFLIGMMITPLIFLIFSAAPQILAQLDRPSIEHYGVVDQIGAFAALEESVASSDRVAVQLEIDYQSASERVQSGAIAGFLVLDEAFVQGGEAIIYVETAKSSVPSELRAALTQLLQHVRIETSGLDPADVMFVTARADVTQRPLVEGENDGAFGFDPARMVTMGAIAVMLAILIMSSGAMLLQSALQEKRDRMSEVVLSSIDAKTLMAGKIVGHLILGIVQILVWLAIGLPIAMLLLDFPIFEWVAWELLPIAVVFFIAGYLFFSALFVGAGATMEDIQSAGNAQGMVFMLPFTAALFIAPVINNPEGVASRIGTFIPMSSPFLIMLRSAMNELPLWEMIAAGLVLFASTGVVVLLAARLFRVGMLMYGKSATPREIWRWLRHG